MRNDDEIAEACGRLRKVLVETRSSNRRDFLTALAQASVGSALLTAMTGPFIGTAAAADPMPVTTLSFGGAWKAAMLQAFCDPFTKQTGIPVRYEEPYTFAKLRAMHNAHAQQIDVAELAGTEVILANRLKMATPLDWTVIDRSALAPNQYQTPNVIGASSLSTMLCYNKKKWPGDVHPNSWADLWDVEKFPGRRALRRSQSYWIIEAAVKAAGVKDENFYPIDLDLAFQSLDKIKPHVKTWWSDNSQAQQLMEQEEVDLIVMTNGRASDSIVNHGAPFEMVWNESISDGDSEGWICPVGCPNPQGAMKLLDVVGRAEPQAVFARLLFYAPVNPKAFDYIDEKLAKLLPTYPANAKLQHFINFEWWADNSEKAQRRFEQWLQS